jgi:hypothetical protein
MGKNPTKSLNFAMLNPTCNSGAPFDKLRERLKFTVQLRGMLCYGCG